MPLPVFWILIIVSGVFFYKKKIKKGNVFIATAGLWLFVVSTPFLPTILVNTLEKQYPSLINPAQTVKSSQINIIVLGAGHIADTSLPANDQLGLSALGRLVEGIRIQRILTGSRLVLSGWGGPDDGASQASILRAAALILGVPDSTISIQESPRNTREEAEAYVKNHGKEKTLIVVTSAVHMPRAMKLFKEVGLNPIAAPANHVIKNGSKGSFDWMPSSGNIALMELAIHEYVGIFISYFE